MLRATHPGVVSTAPFKPHLHTECPFILPKRLSWAVKRGYCVMSDRVPNWCMLDAPAGEVYVADVENPGRDSVESEWQASAW